MTLFLYASCSDRGNQEVKLGETSLKEKHGLYFETYKGTEKLKKAKIYNQGVLNGRSEEFYRNGNIKSIQYFDNGFKSDSFFFYRENGNLKMEKELIKFYDLDTPYVNTLKIYDDYGDVIEDSSFYYQFIDESKIYKLEEPSFLKVKLFGSYFNDKMHISTANFDNEFKIMDDHQRYFRNDDFICEIPIQTDKIGHNELKFIINDYTFVNLTDSLINLTDSLINLRQILVNYKYFVE